MCFVYFLNWDGMFLKGVFVGDQFYLVYFFGFVLVDFVYWMVDYDYDGCVICVVVVSGNIWGI